MMPGARTQSLRLSREFSAGCLARGIRPRRCSNVQCFACACAVACWRHLPIFCGSLFLPRQEIGNKVLRKAGTASSKRCAVHIVSHVNTAAETNPERVPLA